MSKLTKKELLRLTDVANALQASRQSKTIKSWLVDPKEIKKIIKSNHEGETKEESWTEKKGFKKRLKQIADRLVDKGKAIEEDGKYRVPTKQETKIFTWDHYKSIVRARQAKESTVVFAGTGAGDMTSASNRSAAYTVAAFKGGAMDDTRVLLAARTRHTKMAVTRTRTYNLSEKEMKAIANHKNISVACLLLKDTIFTVTGLTKEEFENVFRDWSNAKIDKAEGRRLQSLPDEVKKYKLAKALNTARN